MTLIKCQPLVEHTLPGVDRVPEDASSTPVQSSPPVQFAASAKVTLAKSRNRCEKQDGGLTYVLMKEDWLTVMLLGLPFPVTE